MADCHQTVGDLFEDAVTEVVGLVGAGQRSRDHRSSTVGAHVSRSDASPRVALRLSRFDGEKMLGVITDDDGRVPVRCGEDFLVLLGDQADAGGAIQRLQGGVELGPRGVGKRGAKPGEAAHPPGRGVSPA